MSLHLSKIRVIEKSNSKKWKSAEHKRKAEELEQSWNQIKSKYEKLSASTPIKKISSVRAIPSSLGKSNSNSMGFTPPRGTAYKNIPSRVETSGLGTKPEQKVYTGDAVLGISIVHKSCLQPVFTEEQAKDLANMRR